jgi:hypothetical protein
MEGTISILFLFVVVCFDYFQTFLFHPLNTVVISIVYTTCSNFIIQRREKGGGGKRGRLFSDRLTFHMMTLIIVPGEICQVIDMASFL